MKKEYSRGEAICTTVSGDDRMNTTVPDYNVYHSVPGAGDTFLGVAHGLDEAEEMARRGGGIHESVWGAARAAGPGGYNGWSAPDKSKEYVDEDDEPDVTWLEAGDGYYCAVLLRGPESDGESEA